MKKIAILSCIKASHVCSGASCLAALKNRTGGFARYAGDEVELTAFFHCNGCDKYLENDGELREKAERVVRIGTECVHIGICCYHGEKQCPNIRQLRGYFEENGMETVTGTHG